MANKIEDKKMLVLMEDDESMGSAQALITLHDSVQNMPKKHKSALQEAVLDVSPVKKNRTLDYPQSNMDHSSYVTVLSHVRKQLHPLRLPDEIHDCDSMFSNDQTATMKELLNNINNILKQAAGRRWVYYEWFYSNIDRALLLGENDFQSCLRLLFKEIKIKQLTRTQWSMIRRLMGKPRRCSPAFFKEERLSLEEKRKKIRYLHQLKGFEVSDISQFKDLPDEIPMPMVIGTKVTAKVRPTVNGLRLFTGTVDAVGSRNNTFRVTFDREGIGTHSVPDVEVASEHYESMNLQLFIVKERPRIAGATSPTDDMLPGSKIGEMDPVGASSVRLTEALSDNSSGTYGGFPVRFLLYLTKLTKIIALKRKYVVKLKEMNSAVELLKPYKKKVTWEFKRKYAFIVLELEKTNTELKSTFTDIRDFMHTVTPELGLFDPSSTMKEFCDSSAKELVEQSHRIVTNMRMKDLVTKLTALMLQINCHAELDKRSVELSSLDEAVHEIKTTLHPNNIPFFEDKIETQLAFIKNGLQHEDSMLAAFTQGRRGKKKPPLERPSSTASTVTVSMSERGNEGVVGRFDEEEVEEMDIEDEEDEEIFDEEDDL